MKKIISMFVLLSVVLSFCSCSINDIEKSLIKQYEKQKNAESLYNLMMFYYEIDNTEGIVKYTEEFFIENNFSAVEIIRKKDYKERDVDFGKGLAEIKSDEVLGEYLYICSTYYEGDEYLSKSCEIYQSFIIKFSTTGYYEKSMDNYVSLKGETDLCLDIYDYLFENSNQVVVKKAICESKLEFVEKNNLTELKADLEKQVSEYDLLVSQDMSEARAKGVDVTTYMEKVQKDEDWR